MVEGLGFLGFAAVEGALSSPDSSEWPKACRRHPVPKQKKVLMG